MNGGQGVVTTGLVGRDAENTEWIVRLRQASSKTTIRDVPYMTDEWNGASANAKRSTNHTLVMLRIVEDSMRRCGARR